MDSKFPIGVQRLSDLKPEDIARVISVLPANLSPGGMVEMFVNIFKSYGVDDPEDVRMVLLMTAHMLAGTSGTSVVKVSVDLEKEKN